MPKPPMFPKPVHDEIEFNGDDDSNESELESDLSEDIKKVKSVKNKKDSLSPIMKYRILKILEKMSRQKQYTKKKDGTKVARWADPNCKEPDYLELHGIIDYLEGL